VEVESGKRKDAKRSDGHHISVFGAKRLVCTRLVVGVLKQAIGLPTKPRLDTLTQLTYFYQRDSGPSKLNFDDTMTM